MLHPIQYALPGIALHRAAVAPETARAVPGAAEGDRAGNDVPRERGAEAQRLAQEARDLVDDPNRPVGPPPAFQANVLEAERARLKSVERAEPDAAADRTAQDRAEGEAPAVVKPYAEVPAEMPSHGLDLSR